MYLSDGDWFGGAVLTNPATNAILDDSGALLGGNYLFAVIAGGTVAFVADVEHRNAANSANVNAMRIYVPANSTILIPFPNDVVLAVDERVRVKLVAGVTGDVSMALFGKLVP